VSDVAVMVNWGAFFIQKNQRRGVSSAYLHRPSRRADDGRTPSCSHLGENRNTPRMVRADMRNKDVKIVSATKKASLLAARPYYTVRRR
jgi:hypothetical protein